MTDVQLVEQVALAMADAEGNREAQERAHLNNYDALGYGTLAAAALVELERLGRLAGATTANTTTGAASDPPSDFPAVPSRGVPTT